MLRCADGTLYTGIALDLAQRLRAHAQGRGAKYTRGRGPHEVVLQETHASKSDALKRERAIKKLSRAQKLALAEAYVSSSTRMMTSTNPPPPPSPRPRKPPRR